MAKNSKLETPAAIAPAIPESGMVRVKIKVDTAVDARPVRAGEMAELNAHDAEHLVRIGKAEILS